MLAPVKNFTLTPLKIIPSVTFTNFAFAVGLYTQDSIKFQFEKIAKNLVIYLNICTFAMKTASRSPLGSVGGKRNLLKKAFTLRSFLTN